MSGKIATELEARLIGNKDGGFPSDVKCCSAIRASSFGCEYPSEYSGYRLVPKNVLTASAPRFMFYGTEVIKSPFYNCHFRLKILLVVTYFSILVVIQLQVLQLLFY